MPLCVAQQSLRDQGPPAACGPRQSYAAASALQNFNRCDSHLWMVMVEESVVEERHRAAGGPSLTCPSGTAAPPLIEGLALPGRGNAPAVEPQHLLIQPAHRRASGAKVRQRSQAAPPPRKLVNVAQGAGAERSAVPLPVV